MAIRILLVDDQLLVVRGLEMLLDGEPDFDVVGTANNGAEAVEVARRLAPDVVLMDIRMPVMDGVSATRELTADGFRTGDGGITKVLVLTTFKGDSMVLDALRAGASGFLLKDTAPVSLATAVRAVQDGGVFLDPAVARGVVAEVASRPTTQAPSPGLLDRLTSREKEVLVLMAQGLSNGEIAQHLFVVESTVKTHVSRVLMKLEVGGRTQAVVMAYETGLVTPRVRR